MNKIWIVKLFTFSSATETEKDPSSIPIIVAIDPLWFPLTIFTGLPVNKQNQNKMQHKKSLKYSTVANVSEKNKKFFLSTMICKFPDTKQDKIYVIMYSLSFRIYSY